jgi:DNA-binding CsgD family transcriptional regulator
MQAYEPEDVPNNKQEIALMREWEIIQHELLALALTIPYSKGLAWRQVIDTHIIRVTKGQARLYWEPLAIGDALGYDRFCEVRYQQIRYGFLAFMPGYLVSSHCPDIPQHFAHLCALLLAFAEYRAVVHFQLDDLPPLLPSKQVEKLTRRERDVLLGLVRGASDVEMAQVLGIEPTTVHTHRKRLYRRLGVHSVQEATLRCFTHRLIDWLNGVPIYPPGYERRNEPARTPFSGVAAQS